MIKIDIQVAEEPNWPSLQQEVDTVAGSIEIFTNRVEIGGNLYARFNVNDVPGSQAMWQSTLEGVLSSHNPSAMTDGQMITERLEVSKSEIALLDASGATIVLTDEQMAAVVIALQLLLGVYTPQG